MTAPRTAPTADEVMAKLERLRLYLEDVSSNCNGNAATVADHALMILGPSDAEVKS